MIINNQVAMRHDLQKPSKSIEIDHQVGQNLTFGGVASGSDVSDPTDTASRCVTVVFLDEIDALKDGGDVVEAPEVHSHRFCRIAHRHGYLAGEVIVLFYFLCF